MVTKDRYVENTAGKDGGAIFLDWESLSIKDSEFVGNTAERGNGGAISFLNLDENNQRQFGYLSDVSFINNYANITGGALHICFDYLKLKEDPMHPAIFGGGLDWEGQPVTEGKPSYYVFTYYDLLVDSSIIKSMEPREAIQNTSLTVNLS